jgi:hypothetical protein
MTVAPTHERPRYRFGPSDSLGIVGTARASQCAVVLVGVALTLAAMYALPAILAPVAFLPLAFAAAAAFTSVRGAPVLDWARLAVGFRVARGRSDRRWRSTRPTSGVPDGEGPGSLDTPASWGTLSIVAVPYAGRTVGVVLDQRRGTATATLLVRVDAFALLAEGDQERRVAAWGQVLASLSRESSAVRRISWTERTVPAEADEIAAYFANERDRSTPLDAASVLSYVDLIDSSTSAALEHECFVSVQIDTRKRRREIRQRALAGGDEDLAAGLVVVDELRLVAQGLAEAGVGSVGALPPRLLAAAIRHGVDPGARSHLARLAAAGASEGCAPDGAGPLACDEHWDCVHTDSAWHATFWISRWPLRDVGCLFLSPLLNRTQAQRTVSMTAEPIAPSRAYREAERAMVKEEGDEVTRTRHGFLQTARHRRRQDDVADRESELADGHSLMRFAGHVTVTAASREELEAACAEVVQAAQHSHLELRRLYGEQACSLAFTLPGLARGLD